MKMNKIKFLHKQVELFHKLAHYGDREVFLEAVAQQPSLSGPTPPPPGTPKPTLRQFFSPPQPPTTTTEQTIVGNPPVQYPSIPTDVQDQLNQLLVPTGSIMPLKLDGKFGPLTQQAAKLFTQKFNKPATPANIKEEYLAMRNPELETKFPA